MKTTAILIFTALSFVSVYAAPPETFLTLGENQFSSHVSQNLESADPLIEAAVVVVHGSERNANTYYDSIDMAAHQLGHDKSTLIVSPHFKNASDSRLPNELVFTDEGWLRGDRALNAKKTTAFDVIDAYIKIFLNKNIFPNLKRVVLTGHSAGGQLTQRYAIGSRLESENPGIQFNYIVLNPGSYAYLTATRPVPGQPGKYEVPRTRCAYNSYKYGLQGLNEYMSRAPLAILKSEYLKRKVTYLIGEKDIITDELNNDCPAQLQGSTRLERAQNFKAQLDFEFPGNPHALTIVPGIGHTERGMYMSETGLRTLFP